MRIVTVIVALLLCLSQVQASAPPVRVYRCVDDQGRISLQDRPCPAQSEQQRRDYRRPPESDRAAQPEPADELESSASEPPKPTALPLPPPPLWQCRNWKGEIYESETGYTRPRCIPIGVIGPEVPLGSSAAALCRWVEDDCRRLDDVSACQRWRQKLPETERELRFAASDRSAGLREEIARIKSIIRQSCPR